MTETEENKLLMDAEMRRRVKADEWAKSHPPAKKVGDSLEGALERFRKLHENRPTSTEPPTTNEFNSKPLIEAAGIPLRHQQLPGHSDSLWQLKLEETSLRLGSGFLIAITGTQGTGKTQFGAALIVNSCQLGRRAKYACAMDFFIALKGSFDDGSKVTEASVLNTFTKPKLLVLDEMDERSESAWENRLLFHMLNQRYNAMLDTLLVSRRSKLEFVASLGASIQSRIQETGGTISFNWPSFRACRMSKPNLSYAMGVLSGAVSPCSIDKVNALRIIPAEKGVQIPPGHQNQTRK